MIKNSLEITLVRNGSTTYLCELRINRKLADKLQSLQMDTKTLKNLFYLLIKPLTWRFK